MNRITLVATTLDWTWVIVGAAFGVAGFLPRVIAERWSRRQRVSNGLKRLTEAEQR